MSLPRILNRNNYYTPKVHCCLWHFENVHLNGFMGTIIKVILTMKMVLANFDLIKIPNLSSKTLAIPKETNSIKRLGLPANMIADFHAEAHRSGCCRGPLFRVILRANLQKGLVQILILDNTMVLV